MYKFISTDQEIFVWDAIEERRRDPAFRDQPASEVNSANFEVGRWRGPPMREQKHVTEKDTNAW